MGIVAWVATVAMLVGWRTRASVVVSWLAAASLASYQVSFTASWSHHNNLPLLAQLAFFGARGGDTWSLDAWRRRRRGSPPLDLPGGYQWSLRLVQIAVGLMFFSAAMAKWFFGDFTLAWAFSDNLRHQLLARFDWIGAPRTAAADWLLGDVWRYQAAAALNLLAQVTPLTAVLLVDRPRLRLAAGLTFVVEVLALGVVMDLWNVHWLPLLAVFVDWEHWLCAARGAKERQVRAVAPQARPLAPLGAGASSGQAAQSARRRAGVSIFVVAFLAYDLGAAFWLDQSLRTYPFSAYPMFGYVRAKRPYHRHATYEMPGAVTTILAAAPVPPQAQAWVDGYHTFRMLHRVRSAKELRQRLGALTSVLQAQFPELGVWGVRLHLAAFQAEAYPAVAALRPHRLAVLGELGPQGLISALGRVQEQGGQLVVEPQWTGPAPAGAITYAAIADYSTEVVALTPVPGPQGSSGSSGTSVRLPRPRGDSVVVLAVVDGVSYVVGEVGHRRW
ncbi:MAG: hypothetical protein IPI49_11420 [Myxococcales bacterium]|nr:hypothetical protein [Myxococcales bacterium]